MHDNITSEELLREMKKQDLLLSDIVGYGLWKSDKAVMITYYNKPPVQITRGKPFAIDKRFAKGWAVEGKHYEKITKKEFDSLTGRK